MKRYLAGSAVVAALVAIGAGTSAASTFDPVSQSGFISRGDVIAAGGKNAIIPNPVVTYAQTTRSRLTCTWSDSTQLSTTLTSTLVRNFVADTRYAPGSRTITGYFVSKDNEFNSEIDPAVVDEEAICWSLRGLADEGPNVQTGVEQLSTSSTLTFTSQGHEYTVG
jgi:hypothetical protein